MPKLFFRKVQERDEKEEFYSDRAPVITSCAISLLIFSKLWSPTISVGFRRKHSKNNFSLSLPQP